MQCFELFLTLFCLFTHSFLSPVFQYYKSFCFLFVLSSFTSPRSRLRAGSVEKARSGRLAETPTNPMTFVCLSGLSGNLRASQVHMITLIGRSELGFTLILNRITSLICTTVPFPVQSDTAIKIIALLFVIDSHAWRTSTALLTPAIPPISFIIAALLFESGCSFVCFFSPWPSSE